MDKTGFIEADDYYDMGCQWRIERDWDKAISCFKHAIELNRYLIYAYIDLAAVYAAKGEYHDAVSILKKGVKSDPRFDLLYYKIARYLYKNGEFQISLKYIDEAINLNDCDLYQRVKSVISRKMDV